MVKMLLVAGAYIKQQDDEAQFRDVLTANLLLQKHEFGNSCA